MVEIKKKILFLTPQLPYPPISGGVIKSWKLLEYLSSKYETYLACFLKNEDDSSLEEMQSKIALSGLYTEKIDVPRNALNFIKSNLQGIALNLYRNKSSTFKKHINSIINDFDIVFVDHYEVFQYVSKTYKGRIVLHEHNCEYLMWERFARLEKNPAKKIALKNQSFLIKKYERKICNTSHAVLAAPNDIEELIAIGAQQKKFFVTYHLGDESLLEHPDLVYETTENAFLFVGTLTWEANVDGLLWFIENQWERLSNKISDVKFYIIGKNPDARIKMLAEQYTNIELTGFVEDLEPYFKKCRVFLCPLRFGSGIKVKVINSMYRGIPTVTTSVGAEGLGLKNGEEMIIEDNLDVLTDKLVVLMGNEDHWNTLSKKSRQFAFKNLTWERVFIEVDRALKA